MRQPVVDEIARQRLEGVAVGGGDLEVGCKPIAATGKPASARLLIHPPRQRPFEPPRCKRPRLGRRVTRHARKRCPLEVGAEGRVVFKKRPARCREL